MKKKLMLGFLASLVSFSVQAADIPQLAVRSIEDQSASGMGSSCGAYGVWATPGNAARELLINELVKSRKIAVVEDESDLGKEGKEKALRNKRPQTYAIAGVISEFEWCISGGETGLDIGGLLGMGELSLADRSGEAHVGIDLRLIDLSSGRIIETFRGESRVSGGGYNFEADGFGVRLNKENFEKSPLGQATRAAIAEAAKKILATVGSGTN